MNPQSSQKKVVLVVEDHLEIRKTLVFILESRNYQVIEAGNGAEALKRLAELPEPPFALITDWNMPVMDGLELLRRVASLGLQIQRIIVVSALVNSDHAAHERFEAMRQDLGFSFLEKPYLLDALIRLLEGSGGE